MPKSNPRWKASVAKAYMNMSGRNSVGKMRSEQGLDTNPIGSGHCPFGGPIPRIVTSDLQ